MGSEGTLGIFTSAVLKLFPAPKSRVTALVGVGSPHVALKLFQVLRARAGESLTAFEYLPRFALEIVLKHAPGAMRPLAGDHEAYALVELASPNPEADLAGLLEEVLGAGVEEGLVEDATIASSDAQRLALWNLRERLSDTQRHEGGSI